MAVELRELGIDERHIVARIAMDPGQEAYAGGTIDQVFAELAISPERCHPFALVDDDTTVGFFVAREGAAIPSWVKNGCISLHNLRIDHQAQGRGHGKAALRLAAQWILANRPAVTHVMASVNVNNILAMKFNLGRGFTPTGTTIQGRLGPQRVLVASVDSLAKDQRGTKSLSNL